MRPDSKLTESCPPPVDLGADQLTQKQIEEFWTADRYRLVTCRKRHAALRDFFQRRDADLEGRK